MKKLTTRAATLALAAGAFATFAAAPASATATDCGSPDVVACFTYGDQLKQTPENIVQEPDGSFDVTLSLAQQVARVGTDGRVRILVRMPVPDGTGGGTPLVGHPVTMGLVRAQDGTLFFLYANGDTDQTGVWRLRPHTTTPEQVAQLPNNSLPNSIALDGRSGLLYISDSALGRVWTVPTTGGTPTVFSDDALLAAKGFGANGLKLHHHAVWVSNSVNGTIVRIPILRDGRSGRPEVRADNLSTVDDFAFTGHGDELLAALNGSNEVVRVHPGIHPDHTYTVVRKDDGLQNPTSLVIHDGTAYVANGAYFTKTTPNILAIHLDDEH
ncbi:hypothetical protein ACFXDE_03105 [Kitasatospora sp. NPDC059408]|uniref:hypothetical protein n=1 Tax=Kitasatospora sp. NPDC059408 TaxID=3346823 RepID=UPI0036A107ED